MRFLMDSRLCRSRLIPPFPQVAGSSCHVSIWSDRPYNDSNGNPVTVPNTLFWTDYNVFLDSLQHVAPISCTCCQFSGVDTSCQENVPLAQQPSYLTVVDGVAEAYRSVTLTFNGGFQLNYTDYAELRNDTLCGYLSPRPVLRSAPDALVAYNQSYNAYWNITSLPSPGCYTVCYFASSLTTPQWYNLGTVTVSAVPSPLMSFVTPLEDTLFAGNTITITYTGKSMLSVFDDAAELRSSGLCGSGSPAITTVGGTSGTLQVVNNQQWCQPSVKPSVTSTRPLNYIQVQYSDCPPGNRLYQSQVQWTLQLPVTSATISYSVCYRTGATAWSQIGTMTVVGQLAPAAALYTLYSATNGPYWNGGGWTSSGNPCTFFAVRCNVNGQVTMLLLSRNNLTGTIPSTLFYSSYFTTITHIALDMNNLSGTIPSSIGSLINLNFLDIGFNQLTGTIPNALSLTNVYMVYVGNNKLSGYAPDAIESISLSWFNYGNNVSAAPVLPPAPGCPVDIMECSDVGSTAPGVTPCGFSGITEAACLAYGCCFNAQAPLIFGGTACFTQLRTTYAMYPPCQALSCFPV